MIRTRMIRTRMTPAFNTLSQGPIGEGYRQPNPKTLSTYFIAAISANALSISFSLFSRLGAKRA